VPKRKSLAAEKCGAPPPLPPQRTSSLRRKGPKPHQSFVPATLHRGSGAEGNINTKALLRRRSSEGMQLSVGSKLAEKPPRPPPPAEALLAKRRLDMVQPAAEEEGPSSEVPPASPLETSLGQAPTGSQSGSCSPKEGSPTPRARRSRLHSAPAPSCSDLGPIASPPQNLRSPGSPKVSRAGLC
jgi:hypothetical protein